MIFFIKHSISNIKCKLLTLLPFLKFHKEPATVLSIWKILSICLLNQRALNETHTVWRHLKLFHLSPSLWEGFPRTEVNPFWWLLLLQVYLSGNLNTLRATYFPPWLLTHHLQSQIGDCHFHCVLNHKRVLWWSKILLIRSQEIQVTLVEYSGATNP